MAMSPARNYPPRTSSCRTYLGHHNRTAHWRLWTNLQQPPNIRYWCRTIHFRHGIPQSHTVCTLPVTGDSLLSEPEPSPYINEAVTIGSLHPCSLTIPIGW